MDGDLLVSDDDSSPLTTTTTNQVNKNKRDTSVNTVVVDKAKYVRGYGWNIVRKNPAASFIVVSGIIGAGKTLLSERLSKKLNVPCIEEEVDTNPYLADFYNDMAKYGFAMQIYLLNRRFVQHQKIIWTNKNSGAIQDRSIYEDTIFAKMLYELGTMTERDYQTYMELFQNMLSFLRKPDMIIFLDVGCKVALDRIHVRGRSCEKKMSIDYLSALDAHYRKWLQEASLNIPVFSIKWDAHLDTIKMEKYDAVVDKVIEKINAKMELIQRGEAFGIVTNYSLKKSVLGMGEWVVVEESRGGEF